MEIEAKIALTDDQARALRERLGAPKSVHQQRDVYMQTAGLPVALRVREEDNQAWVTLKSGFGQVSGIRVREELEPSIRHEEVSMWLAIFEKLGMPSGMEVRKHRETYPYDGVIVVIDEVEGLGTFAEVEALADDAEAAVVKLEATIAELGMAELPRLTDSYRKLLAKRHGQ
ncbi:MAG TPA: class IV adenylate cyclase [Oscillatoriaceae cyanobacterium]